MRVPRRSEILHVAHRAAGFTLLELVLVIAVLAILATIAIRSMDGVEDQARFDTTQRALMDIRSAIDGDRGLRQPDGSQIPNGFVADMGRLPNLIVSTPNDPATQLQELWLQPTGVLPYAIRQAPAPDQDLRLGTGWHGPYLQLPIGGQRLVDGWNNPYSLTPLLTKPTPLVPIASIQSLGSDNAVGTIPSDIYSADLPASPILFSSSDYATTVICTVSGASTAPMTGKLFQPDGMGNVTSVSAPAVAAGNAYVFTFLLVSPGSRIIRIYSDATATVPITTQYVTVPKGGLPNAVISLSPTTQPSSPITPGT